MNGRACCGHAARRRGVVGTAANVAGAMGPPIAIALLPKCPACIAAYLAVATGLGFTAADVTWARYAMIGVSLVAGVVLAWRLAMRPARRRCASPPP